MIALDASGADLRETPVFQSLQSEMDKLTCPAPTGGVNWHLVVSLANQLQEAQPHDLLIASYRAGGLFHVQGLTGLADGLQAIEQMIIHHWDSLYPPLTRLRARRNALLWLVERLQSAFANEDDWQAEQVPAMVDRLCQQLDQLDRLLQTCDPECPSLRPLRNRIALLPQQSDEPAPAATTADSDTMEAPVVATPASPPTTSPTPAAMPAALPGHEEITSPAICSKAMDALSDYAAALRSLTPHAATAWRLNRVAAWARLDCLPSHESGKTHLRAPLSQQVSILQQLNSQQANHELLAFTEVQLGNHPFWLDLNHAAAQALSRLGEDYQPARAEVELATVQLCQRLPGIDSLLFADGMACANPETRAWLQQLATNHGCSVMPSLQALTLPDNATQPATSTSPSARRDQLLAMLQQCRSMLAQRPQPVVLAGFMQAIMAEIDRFSLESWEPKLAIQALGVAYAAAQRMENTERASSLLARILLLDPEEAARLHG